MLICLALVPVADVARTLRTLRTSRPAALAPVHDFFRKNYVTGIPARGNYRAVPLPSPPHPTWNQYESALDKFHRTNNISKGWHDRFRQVVGKGHPDLYSTLIEFQKEQGFTEKCIQELALGKKVKNGPDEK